MKRFAYAAAIALALISAAIVLTAAYAVWEMYQTQPCDPAKMLDWLCGL